MLQVCKEHRLISVVEIMNVQFRQLWTLILFLRPTSTRRVQLITSVVFKS